MSDEVADPGSSGSDVPPAESPKTPAALPEELRIARAEHRSPFFLIAGIAIVVVALVGAAFGLHAFGGNSPSSGSCPTGQTVDGAGSTFVAPLMDAWEINYTAASVNYEAVGSGTGVQDLQALAVDFAASDAPLTPFQLTEFSGQPLTMPEAAGAVAVIYHVSGLSAPLRVNGTWLALVFMGSITNWNDSMLQTLNPGVALPDEPIIVVHRSDGSGTSYVFQQYLSLDNRYWSSNYNYSTTWLGPSSLSGEIAAKGSSGVSQAVLDSAWSISYVDLTYAFDNKLTVASVENPSKNFIAPTLANTISAINDSLSQPWVHVPSATGNWSAFNVINAPGAGDYPLATFTYVMFYEHPDQAYSGVVSEPTIILMLNFFEWVIHEGQSTSPSLYYAPLPAEIVQADQATLGLVTWGNSTVPSCS